MPEPSCIAENAPPAVISAKHEPAGVIAEARTRTQILVIEEPGVMRDGLVALLESNPTLQVIAAVSGRRQALQALSSGQPHVVVMDFSIALKTGPETIAQLKRRWPGVRILVLTFRRDDQFLEAALRAGADGYVLKSDGRDDLFRGLQRIVAGKSYISPAAMEKMVSSYAEPSTRTRGRPSTLLTNREQEVITLIARGYRTREMARMLSLSHKTVEKHRTNLMRKLGLRSAAAVAAYAITHGFL